VIWSKLGTQAGEYFDALKENHSPGASASMRFQTFQLLTAIPVKKTAFALAEPAQHVRKIRLHHGMKQSAASKTKTPLISEAAELVATPSRCYLEAGRYSGA